MTDMPPPPAEPPAEPAVESTPQPAPSPPPAAPTATGPLGQPRSVGLIILLTIVTFGIWALVWAYQNGDELKRHANTGLGGALYLIISFLLPPITMFMMASEVEQLYRREGKEPPITTIWGLWFLLPIIGNIIWYVRIQRSLNDYWTSHGAPA